jgi:hypothetical protein
MNTHKGAQSVPEDQMAEGVGFEPTVGCPTPVFKTGAIDHSATPPLIDCKSLRTLCFPSGDTCFIPL